MDVIGEKHYPRRILEAYSPDSNNTSKVHSTQIPSLKTPFIRQGRDGETRERSIPREERREKRRTLYHGGSGGSTAAVVIVYLAKLNRIFATKEKEFALRSDLTWKFGFHLEN